MTYVQGYQEHLEATLRAGGTPANMDTAVREFNCIGTKFWGGSSLFSDWVRSIQCVPCRSKDESISLNDEISCPACLAAATKP